VLADSFQEWLNRLELHGWEECAISGIGHMPMDQQREELQYYLALNPFMETA